MVAAVPGPARRWGLSLCADAASPGRARAALRDWLGRCDAALVADARLIGSELVANAVAHGRPPILLTAELDDERLRLEVCDAGSGLPKVRPSGPGGGFGLPIVCRLADHWGTGGPPTRVWCELRRRAGGRSLFHEEGAVRESAGVASV